VLGVLLEELAHVPRESITLINAIGTHRPNTPEELEAMLGREILAAYRVVQHNPRAEETMQYVGASSFGNPVRINADFLAANVKILTGFIEPHFFAGFSGGPKAVLLGMAAFENILRNHSAPMIANPLACYGSTDGNPIYEEMKQIAEMAGPCFALNVTLNRARQITGVFAGDAFQAHRRGAAFARSISMQQVDRLFDVVVTTNSGFPLDLNLYQAVKGMDTAARIVKPGGAVVMAAECSQGLPPEGHFRELLRARSTPPELLEMIEGFRTPIQDQWQVQILARILMRTRVYLYSSLPEEEVRGAHLVPTSDIAETVRALLARAGAGARLAVIPEGPQVIPCLP
jgi:nickel-dependent lactate racemase